VQTGYPAGFLQHHWIGLVLENCLFNLQLQSSFKMIVLEMCVLLCSSLRIWSIKY
ncbi:hypothetical protein PDJAM_G00228730, partial [Pangasius djambal]|nr:hypothetical protein [Pangasius djambal]